MTGFLKRKRGFVWLLGTLWGIMFVSAGEKAGEAGMKKSLCVWEAHAYEDDTLPHVPGTSYYGYQWGLKNDGSIRRVTSAYQNRTIGSDQSGSQGLVTAAPQESSQQVVDSIAGVDIGIEGAWAVYEQTKERRMVTVAIIDTGVDTGHEELGGSIWVNPGEIPGDGIDNDHNGYIDDINGWNFYSDNHQIFMGEEDDHGTHGAGTIAAAWDGQGVSGIADSSYVKIMVLKVLGSREGKGISSSVRKAVRYAQDNGADICNISMGSLSHDPELERLIMDSPMLFVVSVGNGDAARHGYDIDELPMYPACCKADNMITVANLMFNGMLDESSNYGAVSVDLAAPGTYILGAVPEGYAFMTGTSMAAPMVAGTAALIYSCRTDLDLMGVKEAIINTTRPMEGLTDKTATGGMLNAYSAITYKR
ncbi:MAG: S8 family serine peptidase [Hungatella sp.]|nr:S8 family serine peptidase [Hungatella sp.]